MLEGQETVPHVIRIDENHRRRMFRAVCSCSWEGNLRTSMDVALYSGELHLARERGETATFAQTFASQAAR
jgi:hypothetical protein